MEIINIGHVAITVLVILLFIVVVILYMKTEFKDIKKKENEKRIRKESENLQDYLFDWNFLWR